MSSLNPVPPPPSDIYTYICIHSVAMGYACHPNADDPIISLKYYAEHWLCQSSPQQRQRLGKLATSLNLVVFESDQQKFVRLSDIVRIVSHEEGPEESSP